MTSGIIIGTPACTTRGFGLAEFKLVAELVDEVLKGFKNNKDDNSKAENSVKKKVIELSQGPFY